MKTPIEIRGNLFVTDISKTEVQQSKCELVIIYTEKEYAFDGQIISTSFTTGNLRLEVGEKHLNTMIQEMQQFLKVMQNRNELLEISSRALIEVLKDEKPEIV